MASIALNSALGNSVSPSFVTAVNLNFSKIQDALNDGVLWRYNPALGQSSMSTDLNLNGYSLLNANVDGKSLVEIKNTAYKALKSVDEAKAWSDVSHQYSEDAAEFAQQAANQTAAATLQAQQAATQARAAEKWASRASNTVASVSSIVAQTDLNTSQLAALNGAVAANKASADSAIAVNASSLSSLSSTVTANKTAADSTATTLSTLSSTVASNKTSADTTATALADLTTRVTTEETKVQSITLGGTGATTASAARTSLGVGYTASTSSTQQVYYFDNGMMLIHSVVSPGTVAASSSQAFTWTFPQAFSQPPHVSCTAVVGYSNYFTVGVEGLSTTAASGYLFNTRTASSAPTLHFFAYGVKA